MPSLFGMKISTKCTQSIQFFGQTLHVPFACFFLFAELKFLFLPRRFFAINFFREALSLNDILMKPNHFLHVKTIRFL
jgi:hypothetical protein